MRAKTQEVRTPEILTNFPPHFRWISMSPDRENRITVLSPLKPRLMKNLWTYVFPLFLKISAFAAS